MKSFLNTFFSRTRQFWKRDESIVLIANLAIHLLVQAFAFTLMPLKAFSEQSEHDGVLYYKIAQNLWPAHPIADFHWHKRILLPVLADLVFPWEKHISFLVIGIVAASLSAVFFYKIAKKYSQHPLRLTAIFSLLPWLFFSAHLGLAEPLLLLFLLAGYYYYTENRPWSYTLCFALALLTKEIAIIPILALTILIWRRYRWKRAATFVLAALPFGIFCLAYGLHWNDCLWCARNSPGNSFTWQTGFWWMLVTLRTGTQSSANPLVAFGYDLVGMGLNLVVMASTAVGIYQLRRIDFDLMLYNLLISFPLLFLGYNIYNLNANLGRQYLISCLVILGLERIFTKFQVGKAKIWGRLTFSSLLIGEFGLSLFWIVLYSRYFVSHKIF